MYKLLRNVLSLALAVCFSSAFAGDWTADPATGCKAWNPNPQPGETITWSGACVDGKASGEGTLAYVQNGSAVQTISCSAFAEGVCSGKQKITFADGTTNEGDAIKGSWQGKLVVTWPNGDRNEWQFVDGKRQKKGVYASADGHRYEGDFDGAKKSGKGVYVWPDGARYEGDFVANSRTGKGTMLFTNGDRYEGDFVDGKMTGRGKRTGSTGNSYEGDFVDGKWSGKGVFTWADGTRYEGGFVDSKRSGKGIYVWPDGTRYEGDFVDGKFNGKGTKTWPNGDRYEGDWLKSNRTGKGVYSAPNGNRYEGEWLDDNRHGYGEENSRDSAAKRGIWVAGKLERACNSDSSCAEMKAEFSTPLSNCKVNDVDINKEYRGECRNGLANGKGRAKGRDVYFGEFKDGNAHGQGSYTWATGDTYEGSWVNGERVHGKYKDKDGTYEGDFLNRNHHGFGVYKYSCSCSFWSCNTCTDKGWWQNGKLVRSCDSKNACEKLNRLEPQIRKAEKEFRCEEAKKLNQELEAVNASAFYFDSCVGERRFNNLVRSSDPQEMYLAAGRYESDGERSRAKTIYRQIVDRFARNPIAIKATDRLTRLADVESVESVGAANRDAVNSVNRRNAEQCQNNRTSCFSGCQIYKDYSQRSSCQSGCPLCAN